MFLFGPCMMNIACIRNFSGYVLRLQSRFGLFLFSHAWSSLGTSRDFQDYKYTTIDSIYNLGPTRRRLAHLAQSMFIRIWLVPKTFFLIGFQMINRSKKIKNGFNVNFPFCFHLWILTIKNHQSHSTSSQCFLILEWSYSYIVKLK
jgi:hypothetical protein